MTQPNDILLDLKFTPDWARKPVNQKTFSNFKGKHQSAKRADGQQGKHRLKRPRPGASDGEKLKRFRRESSHQPHGAEQHLLPGSNAARRPWSPGGQQPPLQCAFIPARRGLKPLVNWLTTTGKAYPFREMTSMFLSKQEFYTIKVQVKKVDPPAAASPSLYQCQKCKVIFLEKDGAIAHVLKKHLDLFYAKEEVQTEPPKGNFTHIAKCGLSGELLGPPNYHSYNEKVMEMHKYRFPALSLDEYRNKITLETDPALIERWKQESSRQIHYRLLQEGEPVIFKRTADVEKHFTEHYASGMINEGQHFFVPGPISKEIDDPAISRLIKDCLAKENRFPLRMSITLQPALRRLGLCIFKTGGTAFVSPIQPHPLDSTQTTELVRSILEFLQAHPKSTRGEILKQLRPNAKANSDETNEILSALRWLIDKGHIIEFFNSKLALPPPVVVTQRKSFKKKAVATKSPQATSVKIKT